MFEPSPQNPTDPFNAIAGVGWTAALGLRLVRATLDEVVAEMSVEAAHLQPHGIVHGGVHATIIESVASIGAALNVVAEGKSVVGLENHTTFLCAVRRGVLRASGKPLRRGRSTHVWEVAITDEEGRLVATGRVRLLVLDANAELAGQRVEVKPNV